MRVGLSAVALTTLVDCTPAAVTPKKDAATSSSASVSQRLPEETTIMSREARTAGLRLLDFASLKGERLNTNQSIVEGIVSVLNKSSKYQMIVDRAALKDLSADVGVWKSPVKLYMALADHPLIQNGLPSLPTTVDLGQDSTLATILPDSVPNFLSAEAQLYLSSLDDPYTEANFVALNTNQAFVRGLSLAVEQTLGARRQDISSAAAVYMAVQVSDANTKLWRDNVLRGKRKPVISLIPYGNPATLPMQ